MSLKTYRVTDLEDVLKVFDTLSSEWYDARRELTNIVATGGIWTGIMSRVPESSRARYPDNPDAGNANLRKSITAKETEVSKARYRLAVASEGVDYAERVHAMPDPLPSGRPVRWTKAGSGNRFLSKPISEHEAEVAPEFCRRLDSRMHQWRPRWPAIPTRTSSPTCPTWASSSGA